MVYSVIDIITSHLKLIKNSLTHNSLHVVSRNIFLGLSGLHLVVLVLESSRWLNQLKLSF